MALVVVAVRTFTFRVDALLKTERLYRLFIIFLLLEKPLIVENASTLKVNVLTAYMSSAIRSYIHRAYKTCTSEGNLNVELNCVKQILINNGFSNLQVDQEIQKYRIRKQDDSSRINKINVFNENQMTKANKIDDRVIKKHRI